MDVGEVLHLKDYLEIVKAELKSDGLKFDENIQVGVMIELPSAALMASSIAKHVDFFSIGTNDLIQYLLAVDRNNELISDLYQEFHPAVLKAIRHIIDVGHDDGIWVGMCGEMAGNPLATVLLLGLGLDEFSLVPSVLPEIKKIIRSTRFDDAQTLAAEVLTYNTTLEVKDRLAAHARKCYPELFELIQNGGTHENTTRI